MVKSNGDLHILVTSVSITMTKQHDLIMMCHVIVRQSYSRRAHDSINESVFTIRERAMVNPNMTPSKDRDTITVRYSPPPKVPWRASYHSVPTLLTIMDMNPMDDNVGHVLDRDTRPTRDVYGSSTTIDGFERVHDELFFEPNRHVSLEDDPEWLVLDDGVS